MGSSICFSVISHGHMVMMRRLLSQLNAAPRLRGVRVVVTLNLSDENFDASQYNALDLIVMRNQSPKGFGENHNLAFSYCEADWFAVLNPDLSLTEEEPFTAMMLRMEEKGGINDTNIGLIAPRVVASDMTIEDSVRGNLTPWSLIWRAFGNRKPLKVDGNAQLGTPFFWLAGMCLMVRADAFRSVQGFDKRFYLYCEDYDLCARLYNAGWAIRLDERSSVIHQAQRDSHKNARHLSMHIISLIKVWLSGSFWRLTLKRFNC